MNYFQTQGPSGTRQPLSQSLSWPGPSSAPNGTSLSSGWPISSSTSCYPPIPPQFPPSSPSFFNSAAPSPQQLLLSPRRRRQLESISDRENINPVVFEGPQRKRRKKNGLEALTDAEILAGDYSDQDICNAARSSWHSECYEHYRMSVKRNTATQTITFVFHCIYNSASHRDISRDRSNTGKDGTNRLRASAIACNTQLGRAAGAIATELDGIVYSPIAHRTLIALRTAHSHRPYNIVNDRFYRLECQLLRPGVQLPSDRTVSADVQRLYLGLAVCAAKHLQTRNMSIHSITDAWTNPAGGSEQGLIIQWYEAGRIYRTILEFIALRERHDGEYTGRVIADALKRYGIAHLLFGINLDNASSCDTSVDSIAANIVTFRGRKWRLRCLLHIINLIAKIIISFFFKEYKRKKGTSTIAGATEGADEDADLADIAAMEIEEEAQTEARTTPVQRSETRRAVKTTKQRAIEEMEQKGIFVLESEKSEALRIFPKVAGLARRVHDSTAVIKPVFDSLVAGMPSNRDKKTLSRRVPTRWGSEHECLDDHLFFKPAVLSLTATSALKLSSYRLTESQWNLAAELRDLLEIFVAPTKEFSKKETPLIPKVIGILDDIKRDLKYIAESDKTPSGVPSSPVIRVAAHAGVLIAEKYLALTSDCEIYNIAIVLSPDKRLQWFTPARGYSAQDVENIKNTVIRRWNESYKPTVPTVPAQATRGAIPTTTTPRRSWSDARREGEQSSAPAPTPAASVASSTRDDLLSYLMEPPTPPEHLPKHKITDAEGDVMLYWHLRWSSVPDLARFASDYCSAPATSIEAERSFSDGRRNMDFMQHNTSHDSFKASMALGSWVDAPFFDLKKAIEVLEHEINSPSARRSERSSNTP